MGFMVETLPTELNVLLLYLFSQFSLSEQALLTPAVEAFHFFLAKLEVVTVIAVVFSNGFALE